MAGEQDLISLGLNIDSFNSQKMGVLKEFITIFNTLSKYDGKIFNPVMGDGLTKFNLSIAETGKMLDDLNSKIVKLNTTLSSKNIAPTQQIQTFTTALNSSAYSLNRHGIQLADNTAKIENLGKGLTRMFGYLRNIAYILPGIGIAGIFDLAFTAIGNAADALFDYTDKEKRFVDITNESNKAIKEQIENLKQLVALQTQFDSIYGSRYTGGDLDKRVRVQKEYLDLLSSEGQSRDKILQEQIKSASLDKERAESVLTGFGTSPEQLEKQIKERSENLATLKNTIVDINNALERGSTSKGYGFVDKDTKTFLTSKSSIEKLKQALQGKFDTESLLLKQIEDAYKGYYDSIDNLEQKKAELEKFNSDQARKLLVENTKEEISVNEEKQKAILSNDRKFHDERQKAILAEYNEELRLAQINRVNVTGTKENPNVSATPSERQAALEKESADKRKAAIKRDQEIQRNDVEFYQRSILAISEIRKDEVEQSALDEEKIFTNEQRSLEERLKAYEQYIIKKQQIIKIEHDLAIQRGASTQGGAVSLTPEEQQRIDVHRDTQQFNVQSDAEKKIYDIVHTSLQLQLKDIIDTNQREIEVNKDAYAKELSDNNERFKKNIFAYEAFKKNKESIDKKYGVILSFEDQISKDQKDIARIKDMYDDLLLAKKSSDRNLKIEQDKLDKDKKSGVSTLEDQRHFDEELGRNEALDDAIKKAQEELNKALKQGDEDKVKQAKSKYEELIEFEKEYAANIQAIQEGLWQLGSELVNRRVENELAAIDRLTQAREEQYSLQEKAIQDSSLSSKDKAALDIQLTEQKVELDKKAAIEERKIKHDAAVKDRELNVAHVTWNTIESVSSALKIAPPAGEILAGERAILGAIEIAQILATPIPSYKHGTENHPGGLARYAEESPELVKEPGKTPYLALEETISHLPAGTKVIPLKEDHPEFGSHSKDESWEQTKYLANQIKRSNKEIKNVFKPTIIVDMSFELRKRQILGN